MKGRFWRKGSKGIKKILGENPRRRCVLNPEPGNPDRFPGVNSVGEILMEEDLGKRVSRRQDRV